MRKVKLEDLCSDIIDCPHTTPKWQTRGIPVIRNFNLHNRYINLDGSDISYVDEATYHQRIKRATPEPGDIVISREAPMGVVGLIPEGMKCCMGQRLVLLKVNRIKCNPVYLLHALTSEYVQTQIRRIDTRGSIVSNIDLDTLRELEIPIIDGQEEAADLLDSISRKIETNTKVIAELESLARTIYDYWFTQFDFPDEHGNPYRSSGGTMVYSELPNCNIPSGWIIKPLGNSAQQCTEGITPNHYPDKTFEYYSIPDFDAAGAPSHMLGKDIQSGKYKITSKDLLLSKLNPQFPRLWDPFCNSSDSICSTEFIVLRPLIDFDKPWFWSVLGSKKFQAFMISNAVSSTGSRSRIHPETVLAYLIPLPPEPIRKQYANKIDPILLSMKKAKQETILLTSLRNWLLPLLMNGQATINK